MRSPQPGVAAAAKRGLANPLWSLGLLRPVFAYAGTYIFWKSMKIHRFAQELPPLWDSKPPALLRYKIKYPPSGSGPVGGRDTISGNFGSRLREVAGQAPS